MLVIKRRIDSSYSRDISYITPETGVSPKIIAAQVKSESYEAWGSAVFDSFRWDGSKKTFALRC